MIYNAAGELLVIERATFDYSFGLPAGHVDKHESFEDAAVSEVREELGLTVDRLRLIAEGRRENPCRRGGTWHYWKVYEAKTSGVVVPSAREVKAVHWCNALRLVELQVLSPKRTRDNNQPKLEWVYELIAPKTTTT